MLACTMHAASLHNTNPSPAHTVQTAARHTYKHSLKGESCAAKHLPAQDTDNF